MTAAVVLLVAACCAISTAVATASFPITWHELAEQDFDFELRRTGTVPAHRYNHVSLWDAPRGRMLVFQGYFYDHKHTRPTWLGDVWAFDMQAKRWLCLHDGKDSGSDVVPLPRYGHSVVLVDDDTALMYGGDLDGTRHIPEDEKRATDLWRFNLRTHEWSKESPSAEQLAAEIARGAWPPRRLLHAAVALREAGAPARHMVVYGGLGLDDTWIYDLHARTWERVVSDGPGVRHGAVAVQHKDDRGEGMLVFGGSRVKPITMFNDLWHFVPGRGWRRLEDNVYHPTVINVAVPMPDGSFRPSGRSYLSGSVVTMPSGDDALILVGGSNCTGRCILFSDVWAWYPASGQWEELGVGSPIATRYHHTLVPCGPQCLVTFGGESYDPRYMYHNAVVALYFGEEAAANAARQARSFFSVGYVLLGLGGIVVVAVYLFRRRRKGHALPVADRHGRRVASMPIQTKLK